MPTSSASTTDSARPAASGGVQSLERAFDLLERMADAGGEVGLSELSASSGLPLPTIHRLMRTLVACGYVRQQPNRRYALGPRLIRLGESASRLLGTWARPYLARLVEETGETANMALLDGDEIVYVAQVPSKHSMRMFTEVGRRVLPHSTGVGKALLAGFPPEEVRALLGRTGMPAATEKTITTPEGFLAALEEVRRRGVRHRRQRAGDRRALPGGPGAGRADGGGHLHLGPGGPGHGVGDGEDRACAAGDRARAVRGAGEPGGSGGLRARCGRAGHGPRRAQHTALTPRRRRAPQITRQTDAPNTRRSHLR